MAIALTMEQGLLFDNELLVELDGAVKDCRRELSPRRVDSSIPAEIGPDRNWLVAQGEWAAKKLKITQQMTHIPSKLRRHVSIAAIPLTAAGGIAPERIQELNTLTEAWRLLKSLPQNANHHLILVCSPFRSNGSEILSSRRKISIDTKKEDLYDAALIAFLFLAKRHITFGFDDIYQMILSVTPRGKQVEHYEASDLSDRISPIQCPSSEHCHSPNYAGIPVLWNSISSSSTLTSSSNCSTKIIRFPDSFPYLTTDNFYMERYKPQSVHPESKSVFSVWGGWSPTRQGWICILTGRDPVMTQVYRHRLTEHLEQGDETIRAKMASHWSETLHHLYHLGFNNYQIIIRDVMKRLYDMKYQSAAKPTVGAGNLCLTYMSHLEYHRRLLRMIKSNLPIFPEAWKMSQNSQWVTTFCQLCDGLVENNKAAEFEAHRIRELIIEQFNLSQSGSVRYLTVLATTFVPLGAVASIFGMNTQEINGSAWPIRYFVISAVPLTILLIVLPLIAFPLLNLLIRFNSSVKLSYRLQWVIWSLIVLGNLSWDIYIWTGNDYYHTLLFILNSCIGLGLPLVIFGWRFAINYHETRQLIRIGRRNGMPWSLGDLSRAIGFTRSIKVLVFLAFLVNFITYDFLFCLAPNGYELIPLGVYGGLRILLEWLTSKKRR
ncbi:hypothetical protein F4680DRAFT_399183 [Xylaria scruposa]|nr:hypothetical protein F4680DRAFT_399183 [Xylaria scruposa]